MGLTKELISSGKCDLCPVKEEIDLYKLAERNSHLATYVVITRRLSRRRHLSDDDLRARLNEVTADVISANCSPCQVRGGLRW